MIYQRTIIRRSSIIAASLLIALVAGCGSESSSSRTLNSAVCFDSPEEKETARKAADQALQEAAQLITNNNSAIFNEASGGGYRVPARRVIVGETTTTKIAQTDEEAPITVPDSSSTTVADAELTPAPANGVDQSTLLSQQLQAIIDTPLCSDIEQNSDTAAADEESSESQFVEVDCPVEASISSEGLLIADACPAVDSFSVTWGTQESESVSGPLPINLPVGDGPVVLTLYAGEYAVFSGTVSADSPIRASGTYFALASSEENGYGSDVPADVLGDEVPEGVEGVDYEMCSLTVTDNTATVDCAVPLYAVFFYHTNTGGDDAPGSSLGFSPITFGPISDLRDMSIALWSGGLVVFSGVISSGVYEFRVDVNNNTEPDMGEGEGEGEEEYQSYFGGYIDPSQQTEFTFSTNGEEPFFFEFYADCNEQDISAQISSGEDSKNFDEMPFYALSEGLCGVWLDGDIMPGEYTITLTAQTDHIIIWHSTHDIFAAIRGSIDYQVDRGTTSAPSVHEFVVPEGGRWFFAEGNTNIGFPEVEILFSGTDPYLLLLDSNDDVVVDDDDSRSNEFDNYRAAGFEIFLRAGTYRLVATTYDLIEGSQRPNAGTDFELVMGLQNIPEQGAISDPITLDESVVNALPIAELATPTDKQNAAAVPSPDVLSQNQAVSIALTSDTKNMVCSEACIEQYFDAADITEGTITLSFGDAKVSGSRGAKRLLIPVNSRSGTLSVTVASADGSASTDFTSSVVVMSPKNSPMAVPSKEIAKQIGNKSGSLPWIPVAGGILVLVAVGAVMRRRRDVA